MFSKESEKLKTIKQLQTHNIDLALASDKKLELLKDKAKELEERLRLFAKNSHDLKTQIIERDKKKWNFVFVGMVLFGILSVLLGGTLIQSLIHSLFDFLFSIVLGGTLGYGLYWAIQNSHKQKWLKGDVKDQLEAISPAFSDQLFNPPSIHPTFDQVKNLKNKVEVPKEKYDQFGFLKISRHK